MKASSSACTPSSSRTFVRVLLVWRHVFRALVVLLDESSGALCSTGASFPVFGYPLFVAMTWVCFPFFLLKQTISVIQLFTAIHKIAEHDTANPIRLKRD